MAAVFVVSTEILASSRLCRTATTMCELMAPRGENTPSGLPVPLRWRSANRRRCSKYGALASYSEVVQERHKDSGEHQGSVPPSHHRAIRWAINVTILSRSYKGAATVLHSVAA